MRYFNKTVTFILLLSLAFSAFASVAFAEGVNWYIKRAGDKRPEISPEHKLIEEYNGYYIDKNVSDECGRRVLYLTFDAGYENGNVELILNTLRDKNVRGAFFLLDNIIIKNTDIVKRMVNEGHLVCNHTKNHKDMSLCSKEEITKNLTELEKIYEEKTGNKMARYFRFPEGRYSKEALGVVNDLGYKTIFWSFGYDDWDNARQPDSEKAIKKILDNTHNGAVILLHPTSKTNAEILPRLIDSWRELGYEFGTLDELTK